jgi:Chaperone of endosialidase
VADGHFSKLDVDDEIVTNNIVVKGVIRGHERGNNTLDVKGKLKADNIEVTKTIKAEDVIILINSSQELKQDISTLTKEEAYSLLEDLEPVKFSFKDDPSKKENIGFIAEDVPDIVSDKDHKQVRYMEIISALTKVVKELKNEVDELKEKIKN